MSLDAVPPTSTIRFVATPSVCLPSGPHVPSFSSTFLAQSVGGPCGQEAHAARLATLEQQQAGDRAAGDDSGVRERLETAEQARAVLQEQVAYLTRQLKSGQHGPPAAQVRESEQVRRTRRGHTERCQRDSRTFAARSKDTCRC